MRRFVTIGLLAATAAVTTPAIAQPGYDPARPTYSARNNSIEGRWAQAQERYRAETDRYNAEWSAYQRARGGRGAPGAPPALGYGDGYADGPANGPGGYARAPVNGAYADEGYAEDDRYENGYDPSRYYRAGPNYRERTLSADDRVYAGTDGRYYCRRTDGTTGLIAGGAAGGILGNVIDGGHSRAAGTLIGGALGALAGRSIEQNQQQIRCR